MLGNTQFKKYYVKFLNDGSQIKGGGGGGGGSRRLGLIPKYNHFF